MRNDLQTCNTDIVVGGCGQYLIQDIQYIVLLAEIFGIRQANVAFVDLGPILDVTPDTIYKLISPHEFTLQIGRVTLHPYTDLINFIIHNQQACYLILINVLCDPRTDKIFCRELQRVKIY